MYLHADLLIKLYYTIPIAENKTFSPHSTMTFVGISLDTLRMEPSLPLGKQCKAKILLSNFLGRHSCKLRELQSLIGFLSFCYSVIINGRAFLRRFIDLTIGIPQPHFHVSLTKAVKADRHLWLSFLEQYNRKSMFIHDKFLSNKNTSPAHRQRPIFSLWSSVWSLLVLRTVSVRMENIQHHISRAISYSRCHTHLGKNLKKT